MRCPKCDTENRESAKFCDQCGNRLVDVDTEPSETAVIPAEDLAAVDQDSEESEKPLEDLPTQEIGSLEIAKDIEEDGADEAVENCSDANDASNEQTHEDQGSDEAEYEGDPTETLETSFSRRGESSHIDDFSGFDREGDEWDLPGDAELTLSIEELELYGDLEDRLVEDGYTRPEAQWRDGNTMRMDPVDGDEQRSRDFLASSTAKKNPRGRRIAFIVIAIIAVIVAAAVIAYALELWGGKSIPDVTGLTEAEATEILNDEGYSVRALQVKSDDTEGLVLVMDPSAGSRANQGDEIVIHVATARLIPDIIGKSQEEAAQLLADSGFENVEFVEQQSSKPYGEVIGVDPEVGKRAKSGDPVTVTTAKPYTVPDISDMYLSDAQAAIEQEGLVPIVEYVYTEDYPEGIIMGTSPIAGTEVEEGSMVSIRISRSRESECIALTQAYLAPGNTINRGLYGYEIVSIDDLTYMGNDTVAYTVTARPYISGFGETAYFGPQTLNGQIVWTAGNEIASIS